ncbi:hypothetical protein BDR06DRAFT_869601 [Suillus hirtellus]|nr:hypothetical protein BDR06DRAFT_869601 [Suillus hirtellus]
MTAWWVKNGIKGPILLMNKDNAATAASEGNTAAVSGVIQVSGHGAVKALDLTGGLMLHRKESCTHMNMEQNVYMALFCQKMAEEMTAFSIWGNCIGHPYMCQIQGALCKFSNILDLHPLHDNLIIHVKKLIVNIDLVISPDATYQTATLDGKPFK